MIRVDRKCEESEEYVWVWALIWSTVEDEGEGG